MLLGLLEGFGVHRALKSTTVLFVALGLARVDPLTIIHRFVSFEEDFDLAVGNVEHEFELLQHFVQVSFGHF